jgi:hypothetical protein
MNTEEIECALMRQLMLRGGLFLPHYTPPKWWECDVFELTKSGYGVEYEVKVSHADFLADSKKERTRSRRKTNESGEFLGYEDYTTNKHELLAGHSDTGPSRFYYVAPAGLISREELPAWAGLIETTVKTGQESWASPTIPGRIILNEVRIILSEVVNAPQLHRVKVEGDRLTDIFKTGYYRYRSQYWEKIKVEKVGVA